MSLQTSKLLLANSQMRSTGFMRRVDPCTTPLNQGGNLQTQALTLTQPAPLYWMMTEHHQSYARPPSTSHLHNRLSHNRHPTKPNLTSGTSSVLSMSVSGKDTPLSPVTFSSTVKVDAHERTSRTRTLRTSWYHIPCIKDILHFVYPFPCSTLSPTTHRLSEWF